MPPSSFQAALKADARTTARRCSAWRAPLADENPPQALAFVAARAEEEPARLPARICVLPHMRSTQDKKAERVTGCEKALAVNPKSLEALALEGGAGLRRGRRPAKYQARRSPRRSKINPTYGEVYRVVGSVTARYYRFDEAAEQVRKAIALDRENMPRLRRARRAVDAHRRRAQRAPRCSRPRSASDPYDVITYNLLELLDTLEPFDTITRRRHGHPAARRTKRR